MVTLVESIEDRYGEEERDDQKDSDDDSGYICFVSVSSSPEAKQGLLPSLITLTDYNIECLGDIYSFKYRINHITELDLADNLISDWSEVANILTSFRRLTFLNLAHNLLSAPLDQTNLDVEEALKDGHTTLRKLVLNGNAVTWSTTSFLLTKLPALTELRLSSNNLGNPGKHRIRHAKLRDLFLSLNPISDFSSVLNLVADCPSLESLSLADCPIAELSPPSDSTQLQRLNLSDAAITSWSEVDKIRQFQSLSELRILDCPFNADLSAEEKREMIVARLPNIQVLNGGDQISEQEREEAERSFIRYFLEIPEEEHPNRLTELVSVHGNLVPLVKIDLTPEIFFTVTIYYGDQSRNLTVSVRQRVKHFKTKLQQLFHMAPCSMRVWYYDQELAEVAGPEEMKWPMKGLYTYDIRDGDWFVVERKQMKKSNGSPYKGASCSPQKKKMKTKPGNKCGGRRLDFSDAFKNPNED